MSFLWQQFAGGDAPGQRQVRLPQAHPHTHTLRRQPTDLFIKSKNSILYFFSGVVLCARTCQPKRQWKLQLLSVSRGVVSSDNS